MISNLISVAAQVVGAISLGYLFFSVFFSDSITEKMKQNEVTKIKQSNLDKIAKVKVVSEDPKEIEKFITENAEYLSDATITTLVARIEMIRTDRVINDDSLLKRRIDDLDPVEIEEEPAVVKRASRKK